nr:ArsA family ATPase [Gemmatimonadota bacterium]NIQ52341.1 ArsA family ATPase [Gemmatimonadota bacterium]NIU72452.1 TRC40/GET3/ArsA family transport-energizing ATPase [Gammaproteobacteria bacterium]NIX42911.1 TRC40/GET3/ArsA family transport-energizing ATPase [Gemmatimonadota bacterium]NIY07087.1 TRC40/GET3/ArsA family transport-energizing ATPase [Gemmatimonadota bacterium]
MARTRILLFTGKGGVGKTTLAAATAVRAAELGHRTLILSSDPAHSLADALDRELGPEPVAVLPGLQAQEIDLYYSMRKHWGSIRELLLAVLRWQGVEEVAAEEMAALPGMSEGASLLWLEELYSAGEHDLIVVDSAPTGETLTLLTLPQVTEWWVKRAIPFQRTAIRTAGFAVRKASGIPLDRAYEELESLVAQLEAVRAVLTDPDVSSIRLVLNPERMVIEEGRRAYAYLQLYGYGIDAALVNRILPEAGVGEALRGYVEAQQRYLNEIEAGFAPLPILRAPHRGREVFGTEALRELGRELYGERDPTWVFYRGEAYRLVREGDGYVLELRLPEDAGRAVTARHAGDEVVLDLAG